MAHPMLLRFFIGDWRGLTWKTNHVLHGNRTKAEGEHDLPGNGTDGTGYGTGYGTGQAVDFIDMAQVERANARVYARASIHPYRTRASRACDMCPFHPFHVCHRFKINRLENMSPFHSMFHNMFHRPDCRN
jgi:hypothetical protein